MVILTKKLVNQKYLSILLDAELVNTYNSAIFLVNKTKFIINPIIIVVNSLILFELLFLFSVILMCNFNLLK